MCKLLGCLRGFVHDFRSPGSRFQLEFTVSSPWPSDLGLLAWSLESAFSSERRPHLWNEDQQWLLHSLEVWLLRWDEVLVWKHSATCKWLPVFEMLKLKGLVIVLAVRWWGDVCFHLHSCIWLAEMERVPWINLASDLWHFCPWFLTPVCGLEQQLTFH